jgi:hypothetical protein
MTDDERATMRDVDHRPPNDDALTGLWRRGPARPAGTAGSAADDVPPDAASDD